MSQYLLAIKLKEKLGFVENPERSSTKRIAPTGKSGKIKKRPIPKGSIQLAPPDLFLKSSSFLKFNLREKKIHPEQVQKLRLETGLEPKLQSDLWRCRLDSDVAKLIFYSYRVGEITLSQGTIGMICDYIALVHRNLQPPSPLEEFWTPARRDYREYVKRLRTRIEANRRHADNSEALKCIEDFLKYLKDKWGVF